MRNEYEPWLYKNFKATTARVKFSDLARIERAYGNLDSAYEQDSFKAILEELSYTSIDKQDTKPNPSRVRIDGGLYDGLSALRHALKQYRSFLDMMEQPVEPNAEPSALFVSEATTELDSQRLSLERDMQSALRRNIEQLESGLRIADGGSEQVVSSGRIDIAAIDEAETRVVIELKAGCANRAAVVQIQSYMGDLIVDGSSKLVRGILVAQDFDAKALAAARVVPTLQLKRYGIKFSFNDVQ